MEESGDYVRAVLQPAIGNWPSVLRGASLGRVCSDPDRGGFWELSTEVVSDEAKMLITL